MVRGLSEAQKIGQNDSPPRLTLTDSSYPKFGYFVIPTCVSAYAYVKATSL